MKLVDWKNMSVDNQEMVLYRGLLDLLKVEVKKEGRTKLGKQLANRIRYTNI